MNDIVGEIILYVDGFDDTYIFQTKSLKNGAYFPVEGTLFKVNHYGGVVSLFHISDRSIVSFPARVCKVAANVTLIYYEAYLKTDSV